VSDSRFAFYWSNPDFREKTLYQRRSIYHDNPEARAAQIERVRARRAKAEAKPDKPRRPNQRRVFEIEGFPVIFVSLGEAAQLVNLSKKGFRTLDDEEVIPRNRLIDRLGRRWYPSDFIAWLAPHLSEQGKKREPRWLLKERVEHVWRLTQMTKIGDRREDQ
jgi:hypothetical protein